MSQALPRPIVKWAGGKRWSTQAILDALPRKIHTYYEPFFGGGSVFWALAREGRFERACIADSNPEVIGCLRALRTDPDAVLRAIRQLGPGRITAEKYYRVRASKPRSPAGQAARFLFLNKTGYNGLYRVNKSFGTFNVPWSKRTSWCPDVSNLLAVSNVLRTREVRILCRDFAATSRQVELFDELGPGDAAYFDPPYLPESATARFAAYTRDGFSVDDHRRLAEVFDGLAARGVHVVASNADVRGTLRLYEGNESTEFYRLACPRAINSKGSRRGKIGELLIVNRGDIPREVRKNGTE